MNKTFYLRCCVTVLIILLIFLGYNLLFADYKVTRTTLEQVHVIFCHGDITPADENLYPKDPHINDTWYPEGLGHLSKDGKMREYRIGIALRKRYNEFLGEVYSKDFIDALSTDYNRAKMSLQLVLAGLYPPVVESQVWNNELPWQPIPFKYVPAILDSILGYTNLYCPKYAALFKRTFEENKFQNFWNTNSDLITYIRDNTGWEITNLENLVRLYTGLDCEVETGRKIPKWTEKVYPDFLLRASTLYYAQLIYDDEMRKLFGGNLLQKIISDATAKMVDTLMPKSRKIYLYSGHEYNIAMILGALKVFEPHIPPYGSYVLIELHNVDGVYGFKILYQNYFHPDPQYLTIPDCDTFCPYNKFIFILRSIIPTDPDECFY